MTWWAWSLAGLGVGCVQLGFGVGGTALFTTVFSLFLNPAAVVAALAIISTLVNLDGLRRTWRHANFKVLATALPAAAVPTLVGAYFLTHLSSHTVAKIIGVAAMVAAGLQLLRQVVRLPIIAEAPGLASVAGVAAGSVGIFTNAAGLVFSIYLLATGIDKRRFVATNSTFLALLNLVKLPALWYVGVINWKGLLIGAAMIPLVLIGTNMGAWLNRRLSDKQFATGTALLIMVLGAINIVR